MILFGFVVGHIHFRNQDKGLRAAVESHLAAVLGELEKHSDGKRFPTLQTASLILNDETVAKRVHVTSLFGTDDLSYNPSQPVIGGYEDVICARFWKRLFMIRANREVREIGEGDLQRGNLVPLIRFVGTTVAEPGGLTNGSQPIGSETNSKSSVAGSHP
jgi:hypothetical protein